MYCKNCGAHLDDDANFCPSCGKKVESVAKESTEETKTDKEEQKESEKVVKEELSEDNKTSRKKIGIIAGAVAVVLILVIGYFSIGLNMQKNSLADKIDASNITEYVVQKDALLQQWNDAGVSEKKARLKDLRYVQEQVEEFEDCAEQVAKLVEEKEDYNLHREAFFVYEEVLYNCNNEVQNKNATAALQLYEDVKRSLETLNQANKQFIEEKINMYRSLNLDDAEAKVKKAYNENLKNIEKIFKESKTLDYGQIRKAFAEMDKAIYMYIEPEQYLNIVVQQVDVTDFPKVKLYLSVKDTGSDQVPEGLDSMFFYINRKDVNEKFIKEKVINVGQLNEKEALKVNMVADVSGSMDGRPLQDAKMIMADFINSVQFNAGDMIELTSFADGVRLEREFTDDASELKNRIQGLSTGNMTSLYDALYTAVGRVASQSGARCVMAFTDGMDNYSNCSAQEVIDLAQRYHIPVFIIGIGNSNYLDASYIAEQTGGLYFNINDIVNMKDIYDQIYRMEKELYLLEFEDTSGKTALEKAEIQVGYHSLEYGGECQYEYTPNTLLSVNSKTFFTDGPEAVVEKYLKNFDDAMTNTDFSYIEDCLLKGSSIYTEQQKYVQRGIKEQLDSYEIVNISYSDDDNCVITTRETFLVQLPNEPLKMMTQECQYALVKTNGEWKMTDFAGPVKVLSKIKH